MKKIIAFMMALTLCFGIFHGMFIPVSAAEGDEIRAAKKIISVVYDDSGSMKGDRWVYANYAMQALTALLNEQDEFYITYMSREDSSQRVNLSDIPGAVKKIRDWDHYSGTPAQSLETAKSKLDSISEQDPSVQFWLVILTDGDIPDLDMTIQDKLNSFKGDKMSNGSALNVAYLAMGTGAESAKSDKGRGLYTFEAADSSAITTAMSEIANLISGRITATDVKQVDSNTISFSSPLPLYSISVLSQNCAASVTAAASAEQTLNVNRNIPLNAYEPFGTTNKTIFGNAAVINLESSGTGQVIQAGTYTITFSEAVSKENLVVQYEPAIGLKMLITRGGTVVDNTDDLNKDDQVSIEIIPVIPGTDDQIDASTLPGGISWYLEYVVDDKVIDSKQSSTLSGITIRKGENVIRGTMQIPGFAPSVFIDPFTVKEIIYNLGVQVDQPDQLSYYRKSTGSGSINGGSLTFWITNDGKVLTKDEQKKLDLRLDVDSVTCDNSGVEGFLNRIGSTPAKCTLKRNDDGSYTLTPNPVVPFTAFLMMAGEYTVTVSIDKGSSFTGTVDPGSVLTGTGTFTMIAQLADWMDLWILLAILAFLLYLFFIIFIKHKFTGQTVCYEVYRPRSDGGGIELVSDAYTMPLRPISLNLFLPKRASEVKFYGLTLQAGPGGSVIVTGKSIAKTVSHYGPSAARPTTALHTIAASLRSTEVKTQGKSERTASDQPLSATRPIYFRTEGDRNIWRIRLQD